MSKASDRRRHTRYETYVPVEVFDGNIRVEGNIRSISISGAVCEIAPHPIFHDILNIDLIEGGQLTGKVIRDGSSNIVVEFVGDFEKFEELVVRLIETPKTNAQPDRREKLRAN
jgi:hypothetical protein